MTISSTLGMAFISLLVIATSPSVAAPDKDCFGKSVASPEPGLAWLAAHMSPTTGPTNDPIRFTIQLHQASVNLGEDVELIITAELLNIVPASMFFTASANSFRLKLLTPEGFQQTGGPTLTMWEQHWHQGPNPSLPIPYEAILQR